ncbi:MAG: peptide chain release factor N(5)-glutamine methyltransferase [Pseudomonadota bacterium]
MIATIGDALTTTRSRLLAAGIDDGAVDARLLVEAATGLDRGGVLAARDHVLDADQTARLAQMVARRLNREPVARILGQREFWSLAFALGPDTLDPRPDSETLVAAALDHLPETDGRYRLLDLGTGTGCLLLALLAERPNAWGLGVDLAEGAAAVACANARSFGLLDRACFMAGNWADAVEARFDMVVCNPPYVSDGERAALMPEVRDHDPALALFAGADGLDAYRALAGRIGPLLAQNGVAALEIGAGQAGAVSALMAVQGLETVETRSDLAAIDRVLVLKPRNPGK